MSSKLVLYIEDDEGIARLVRSHLEKFGYLIEVAETAEAGMEVFDPALHKAILLDYVLPGMSGVDLLRHLAPNKFEPPVVMLTAAGSEKIAVEAINAGAAEYVIKDNSLGFLNLLPICIESAIAKSNLYKENEQLKAQNDAFRKEYLRVKEEADRAGLSDTALGKVLDKLSHM